MPECPEQHDLKISTASCNPASIGLSSANGIVLTPTYDTVDHIYIHHNCFLPNPHLLYSTYLRLVVTLVNNILYTG
jgi:hypothetical protein